MEIGLGPSLLVQGTTITLESIRRQGVQSLGQPSLMMRLERGEEPCRTILPSKLTWFGQGNLVLPTEGGSFLHHSMQSSKCMYRVHEVLLGQIRTLGTHSGWQVLEQIIEGGDPRILHHDSGAQRNSGFEEVVRLNRRPRYRLSRRANASATFRAVGVGGWKLSAVSLRTLA